MSVWTRQRDFGRLRVVLSLGDELWYTWTPHGNRKHKFFELSVIGTGSGFARTWVLVLLWAHLKWAYRPATRKD